MDALCRVCLEEGGNISLFGEDEDMKVYKKIMTCSSITISEEDGFPGNICGVCYSMLDTAYKFRQKCENADERLRTSVTKHFVKVEIEDTKEDFISNTEYNEDINNEDQHNYDDYFDIGLKVENFDNNDESAPKEDIVIEPTKTKKKKTKWKVTKSNNNVVKIKLGGAAQSKKKKTKAVQLKTIDKKYRLVKSSLIATSLLEAKCVWNGFNWSFCPQPLTTQDEIKVRREATKIRKILQQEKTNESMKKKNVIKKRNDRPAPVLCDICGKTYASRRHMETHQIQMKVWKCTYPSCTKSFANRPYLSRHLRSHTNSNGFVCNECGKQFSSRSCLREHIRIVHLKIIRWRQCTHCPQKFRTQKSVDIHVKAVHTGERPHVCTVCDSAFFHTDYLKEHMRLHTGETPFKCPICGRGYAQRCNMKSHMKQHRISELSEQLLATLKPNYLRLLKDC